MSDLPVRSPRLSYRPDVDGLRAVAVLLVLGAHLKTHFSGGYVGVDIFFVISGYLISAHILTEMGEGRFSIVNFYERRIRRIFPALLVVLAATSGLAYHYLFPSELREYAVSMLAALFSYSNMLFWHQAGYFDAPSLLKPLLHTWSLAVEEQFYLFFPLFLFFIRRFAPGRLKVSIYAVTGVTFALSAVLMRHNETAVFFFAPLRAWELLIGTILSQHYLPQIQRAATRHVASLIGLMLIFVPALWYTDLTPFPGLAALPPCLGAALIIASGESGKSAGGWVLSLRPVVFIGLISYSLYLWHWPLVVFQSLGKLMVNAPDSSRTMKLAVLGASLVMGTLSWAFVETPFRKGRFRPRRRNLFLLNGVAVGLLALAGSAMLVTGGVPSRFPADALHIAGYMDNELGAGYEGGVCFLRPWESFGTFSKSSCLHDDGASTHYLLIGDSHAAQLWPGLAASYPDKDISFASAAECKPLLIEPDGAPANCKEMMKFLFEDYLEHHKIDVLLLGGRWDEPDESAIKAVIDRVHRHGTRVVLFGPMIEYQLPLPRVIAVSMRDGDQASVERHRDVGLQAFDARMARVAREDWKIDYVSYYQDLCTPTCQVLVRPGVPMLYDTHHFTVDGSIAFAKVLRARRQIP